MANSMVPDVPGTSPNSCLLQTAVAVGVRARGGAGPTLGAKLESMMSARIGMRKSAMKVMAVMGWSPQYDINLPS